MKLQIDISKEQLSKAIHQRIASIKREKAKPGQNPLIGQILDKDITELTLADASIKEIK